MADSFVPRTGSATSGDEVHSKDRVFVVLHPFENVFSLTIRNLANFNILCMRVILTVYQIYHFLSEI